MLPRHLPMNIFLFYCPKWTFLRRPPKPIGEYEAENTSVKLEKLLLYHLYALRHYPPQIRNTSYHHHEGTNILLMVTTIGA